MLKTRWVEWRMRIGRWTVARWNKRVFRKGCYLMLAGLADFPVLVVLAVLRGLWTELSIVGWALGDQMGAGFHPLGVTLNWSMAAEENLAPAVVGEKWVVVRLDLLVAWALLAVWVWSGEFEVGLGVAEGVSVV